MTTVYAAAISRLGLTPAQAAELHGCTVESVWSRCSGRRAVPAAAWNDLRAYAARVGAIGKTMTAKGAPLPLPTDGAELTAAAELILAGAFELRDGMLVPAARAGKRR